MKKRYIASVLGAMALLPAAGAATATATASPGVQTVGQSAGNAQQATSASEATQIAPSNTNISVRVLSPGNGGAVTQTNSASSDASSSNSNSADQDASQSQAGSGGIQVAGQSAGNAQTSTALSQAYQAGASNKNLPVRVLSPGNDGAVTQSNDASSTASSTNRNTADQSADQSQAGSSSCGCEPTRTAVQAPDQATGQTQAVGGSDPNVQSTDQSAENAQLAGAASSASQVDPKNTNISVRVLSPGNDGNVRQSNAVSSEATASNRNSTGQETDQDQSGSTGGSCGCAGPVDIQTAKQEAGNLQVSGAVSEASQIGARNVNIPVRVLSPGNGGSVDQSNSVSSEASSSNANRTSQEADQDQTGSGGCGCASHDPIQIADQSSGSLQGAIALSAAGQIGAKNDNSPVRVGSSGNDGSVTQSNEVESEASASNSNRTSQDADQDQSSASRCGCGDGVGIQVLGQEAENGQAALSASGAFQRFDRSECGCSSGGNSNGPVRVWSPGNDGSVSQANSAESTADADNRNSTSQDGDQSQSGGSGIAIQALGQEAKNGQLAGALSGAFQLNPSNHNGPTRVYSPGSGGAVDQSNDASSEASADNRNRTAQDADQSQTGSDGCGCGSDPQIQALGQSAGSLQAGFAFSKVLQLAPKSASGGTAVWSPGNGGVTRQGNDASSEGEAENANAASQDAMQEQK